MRLAVVLVAAVALAACSGPAWQSPPGDAKVPAEPVTRSEDWTLALTQVLVPGDRAGQEGNCLAWSGPLPIASLTATATWAAQSPLTQTLELGVFALDNGTQTRTSGSSPLTVGLQAVTLANGSHVFVQVQLPGSAGAAARQDVEVHVVLELASATGYERAQPTTCSL